MKKGTKVAPEVLEKRVQSRKANGRPWHSDETRRKMSLSHQGQRNSMEARTKISRALKGRSVPWAHKILESRRENGKPWVSEKTKQKISNSLKGIEKKPFTEEHKKKLSMVNLGVSEKEWTGFARAKNIRIRVSKKYRDWREAVLKRDNYTCVFCGARGVRLNADHIKPFSRYPELRFEVNNGRTLCVSCHRATPTYGRCLQSNLATAIAT